MYKICILNFNVKENKILFSPTPRCKLEIFNENLYNF